MRDPDPLGSVLGVLLTLPIVLIIVLVCVVECLGAILDWYFIGRDPEQFWRNRERRRCSTARI